MIDKIRKWISYLNSLSLDFNKKAEKDKGKCYWENHPLLYLPDYNDDYYDIINRFIYEIDSGIVNKEIIEETKIIEEQEKMKVLNKSKNLCQIVSKNTNGDNFNVQFAIYPLLAIKPNTNEYLFTIPNISLTFHMLIHLYINAIGKNFEKNEAYMTFSHNVSCGILCIHKDKGEEGLRYFYSTKSSTLGTISKDTVWHVYFQNFTNFYSYFVNYKGRELILSMETTQYRYIPLHEFSQPKMTKKFTSEEDFLLRHPKINEEDMKKIEDLNVLKDELTLLFTSNCMGSTKAIINC